ncbi:A disintegrin and metalloproteinase with thrombospondin motifs adt-1-like [Hydra vulgaris]|uniref:A disintegrin and metalloproteinase with thrombospondin motifs adt-1-like n=1 Tax=Hydra vulgaris TaxID=6087 RepID=A0ABM4CNR4_HYDVU
MKYLIGFYFTSLLTSSIAQILTQWTSFSDCLATCNTANSIRIRVRLCTPSNLCQGISLFDTTPCNTQYSCPDYRLDDWGTWSSCSESCRATESNPTRVRTRSYCLSNSTSAYQCTTDTIVSYEPCNTVACTTVKSCSKINFAFVFVLDSSSSVNNQDWMDEKASVLSFVNSSAFGVNPNVDVAVVNFGSTAKVEADCGTFRSYSTFEYFMNNLKPLGGGTAIHGGLTTAEAVLQRCQKLNMNPVIVLFTDGFENIDTNIDINIAKETRIKSKALLVAGAVNEYKKDEIDRITSYIINGQNVSYDYFATNFTFLLSGFNLYNLVIAKNQCETQGQWTTWTTWGNCSQVCGVTGNMQRSRSCVNPITSKIQEDCELDGNKANFDYMTCFQPCASFSEWSSWGECSASCRLDSGPPTTSRLRTCLPGLGSCIGSSSETQECNTNTPCQGIISSWGAWGQCSATCQLTSTLPTQQRSRTCFGATLSGNCDGQSTVDSQTCSVGIYCPGTISDWSSWGACSSICNNLVNIPFQTRSRSCIGFSTWDPMYMGCPGITRSDQQPCNVNVGCSGSYGAWSGWSSCSETCQSNLAANPFQTQSRPCLGATFGGSCVGPSSQTMACNSRVPCPGVLSDWSTWGACSASCQLDYTLPTQTSTRTCFRATFGGNCNGQTLTQTKNCNAQVYCPGTMSDWNPWGACSSACNNLVNIPFQTRSRSCISYSTWDPKYTGCPGITTSDQRTCNVNVDCSGKYGAWSAWGACSESCQSNPNVFPSQTQTRQCLGATLNGGCPGTGFQTQNCNSGVPCPGFISAWGEWGACSASCQLSFTSPTLTRNRQCFGATFNGNCNGAALIDTLNCNEQVSCPGYLTDWTSWSICLATCQQTVDQSNFSYRSRKCVNASFTGDCGGALLTDQTLCVKNVPCPVSGTWSHWYTSSANSRVNIIQSSLVYLVVLVVLCMHLFSHLFKHI